MERVSNFYSNNKHAVGITYGGIFLTCFVVKQYNAGKRALLKQRAEESKKEDKNTIEQQEEQENIVIFNACRDSLIGHFFSSLIFPWSMSINVVPFFVKMLNPRLTKE